jgi:hypothetical protein
VHAQLAVNTISGIRGHGLAFPDSRAWFASQPIIGHNNRFPGKQYTLETTVRANGDTSLFAKFGIDAIKYSGEGNQTGKPCQVLHW